MKTYPKMNYRLGASSSSESLHSKRRKEKQHTKKSILELFIQNSSRK
jgi:hypothetical protein